MNVVQTGKNYAIKFDNYEFVKGIAQYNIEKIKELIPACHRTYLPNIKTWVIDGRYEHTFSHLLHLMNWTKEDELRIDEEFEKVLNQEIREPI
jgi:hypothetical protein